MSFWVPKKKPGMIFGKARAGKEKNLLKLPQN